MRCKLFVAKFSLWSDTLTVMGVVICFSLAAFTNTLQAGCPGMLMPLWPEPQANRCIFTLASVTLNQGLLTNLGSLRIGVMTVADQEAMISVEGPLRSGASYRVRMSVRSDDIVPIGDSFRRIVEIRHSDTDANAGNRNTPAGSSKDSIKIAARPVKLPGLKLVTGSMTIPLNATATTMNYDIEVTHIAADPGGSIAEVQIWPSEFAKPQTEPESIKKVSVKAGDTIQLGRKHLKLLSVVAPNARPGLRGFIELGE